jgi:hypothetical protein
MPLPLAAIAKGAMAGAAAGAATGYVAKRMIKDSSATSAMPKPENSPAMQAKPRMRPDEVPIIPNSRRK